MQTGRHTNIYSDRETETDRQTKIYSDRETDKQIKICSDRETDHNIKKEVQSQQKRSDLAQAHQPSYDEGARKSADDARLQQGETR